MDKLIIRADKIEMRKRINVNDMIEVELTEYGAGIYDSYWASPGIILAKNRRKGNIIREPLWLIMYIFGSYCSWGGKQVFKTDFKVVD